jgi:hypothetical protein
MNVFFTTVASGSLGTKADRIYFPINQILNTRLEDKRYGDGLPQWFLLFSILSPQAPGHDAPERVLWKKTKRELDMRLTVDCEAFKRGDEQERRNLLVACMRRSLDLMEGKKIPDFDVKALKRDFEQIVVEEGWETR